MLFSVPDFVRNVQVVQTVNTSTVIILWEPPRPLLRGGNIQYYTVVIDGRQGKFVPSEFSKKDNVNDDDDGFVVYSTNVTISSLESGSWYAIRVRASTAAGSGPFSQPFLFQMKESQVPGSPSFVKMFQVGPRVIAARWDYPHNPRGNINGFLVTLNLYPKSEFEGPEYPPPFNSSFVSPVDRYHVLQFPFGRHYGHVAVQARNSKGLGRESVSGDMSFEAVKSRKILYVAIST